MIEQYFQYYYITNYSLELCLEYMKHDNIYDIFSYKWEEREDYYLITFIEYKRSMLSLATSPKPVFKVTFKDLGNQTGINKCTVFKRFFTANAICIF